MEKAVKESSEFLWELYSPDFFITKKTIWKMLFHEILTDAFLKSLCTHQFACL